MGQKQEVDAYLTSFRSVLQLLNAYKELSKLEIPELEPVMNRGLSAQKKLEGFQKRSSVTVKPPKFCRRWDRRMLMDYIQYADSYC